MPIVCESLRESALVEGFMPADDYSPDQQFTSSRRNFVFTIHELCEKDGFTAEWGRCAEGNLFYVDVWGISSREFSQLLKVAAVQASHNI